MYSSVKSIVLDLFPPHSPHVSSLSPKCIPVLNIIITSIQLNYSKINLMTREERSKENLKESEEFYDARS